MAPAKSKPGLEILVPPEISATERQSCATTVPPEGAATRPSTVEPTVDCTSSVHDAATVGSLAGNEERSTSGQEDDSAAAHQEKINTPVILRERNSDGSEVVISDHMTTAALCLQNSLWFELD